MSNAPEKYIIYKYWNPSKGGGIQPLGYKESEDVYNSGKIVYVTENTENPTYMLALLKESVEDEVYGWDGCDVCILDKKLNTAANYRYVATDKENPAKYQIRNFILREHEEYEERENLNGYTKAGAILESIRNKNGAIKGWKINDSIKYLVRTLKNGKLISSDRYRISHDIDICTKIPAYGEWDEILSHAKAFSLELKKALEENIKK